MYAIIETGGKQYRVQEGDVIFVEKLDVQAGDSVVFDKVLACGEAKNLSFGAPYVESASVSGKAMNQGKNKKIIVYKYKAKKGYHKKQGHRQPYTKVQVEKINAG